jgi:hypothetical protein
MGVEMPNQNVYDVGPGQLSSLPMFGNDSSNPIGSSEEFRGSNVEMEDDAEESGDMD